MVTCRLCKEILLIRIDEDFVTVFETHLRDFHSGHVVENNNAMGNERHNIEMLPQGDEVCIIDFLRRDKDEGRFE